MLRSRPSTRCQGPYERGSVEVSIEDCVQSFRLNHGNAYHFPSEINTIQNELLSWFDREKRTNMPWRKPMRLDLDSHAQNQRAYEVWVSEIMLQQTQVATVIAYYNRWMEAFPTIYDLASADIEKVNTLWAGLGYYSRARRLWEGAQKVVQQLGGTLPNNAKGLQDQIPGVGRYTAGAVASIVFNEQTPLVDGNVVRVLSRTCAIAGDPKKVNTIELFWEIAAQLVPASRPGDFNQALMELGARVCVPQNPNCSQCPLQSTCKALAQSQAYSKLLSEGFWNTTEERKRKRRAEHECEYCPPVQADLVAAEDYSVTRYPVKVEKKPPRDEECAVCIVQCTVGDEPSKFLISKRPDTGLLAGLWEFPSVELGNEPSTFEERTQKNEALLKDRYGIDLMLIKELQRHDLGQVVHLFSHIRKVYHVEWVCYQARTSPSSEEGKWITLDELKTAAIPTGLKKALKVLEKFKDPRTSTKTKTKSAAAKRPPGTADISVFFTKK